ncbi:MAG TPA: peroxide stress protein YaaA [Cellvibrionaceae bacterium]
MLMVISPAKTLDFDAPAITRKISTPEFLSQSTELIEQLKALSPADISSLMGISDKLGLLNFDRYHAWQTPFTQNNAKQAILAFKGDVYTGLEAETFSAADFTFAQKQLRILSGLYGLLKPLDLIQPYRLEMGTRFANSLGENLYQFWGDTLTDALNQQLPKRGERVLVNLASNEYFKAVNIKALDARVITPVFKDWKNGQYKIISFFAKKARGMMSAYSVKHRLSDPEGLKSFNVAGYAWQPELSSPNQWVFTRRES